MKKVEKKDTNKSSRREGENSKEIIVFVFLFFGRTCMYCNAFLWVVLILIILMVLFKGKS